MPPYKCYFSAQNCHHKSRTMPAKDYNYTKLKSESCNLAMTIYKKVH